MRAKDETTKRERVEVGDYGLVYIDPAVKNVWLKGELVQYDNEVGDGRNAVVYSDDGREYHVPLRHLRVATEADERQWAEHEKHEDTLVAAMRPGAFLVDEEGFRLIEIVAEENDQRVGEITYLRYFFDPEHPEKLSQPDGPHAALRFKLVQTSNSWRLATPDEEQRVKMRLDRMAARRKSKEARKPLRFTSEEVKVIEHALGVEVEQRRAEYAQQGERERRRYALAAYVAEAEWAWAKFSAIKSEIEDDEIVGEPEDTNRWDYSEGALLEVRPSRLYAWLASVNKSHTAWLRSLRARKPKSGRGGR